MPLVAPFAELESRMHAAIADRLSNVVVVPDGGAPEFLARLSTSDRDEYDATVPLYRLRYLSASAQLADDQGVTIGGQAYRVNGNPVRLNAGEHLANIFKV